MQHPARPYLFGPTDDPAGSAALITPEEWPSILRHLSLHIAERAITAGRLPAWWTGIDDDASRLRELADQLQSDLDQDLDAVDGTARADAERARTELLHRAYIRAAAGLGVLVRKGDMTVQHALAVFEQVHPHLAASPLVQLARDELTTN